MHITTCFQYSTHWWPPVALYSIILMAWPMLTKYIIIAAYKHKLQRIMIIILTRSDKEFVLPQRMCLIVIHLYFILKRAMLRSPTLHLHIYNNQYRCLSHQLFTSSVNGSLLGSISIGLKIIVHRNIAQYERLLIDVFSCPWRMLSLFTPGFFRNSYDIPAYGDLWQQPRSVVNLRWNSSKHQVHLAPEPRNLAFVIWTWQVSVDLKRCVIVQVYTRDLPLLLTKYIWD